MQGRIEQTVLLDTFTEKNFQDIIWSDRYSPIKRISEDTGIAITITKKKAHAIAKKDFESGTGVRSMRNDINLFLNEKLFDNPNIKHVEIN